MSDMNSFTGHYGHWRLVAMIVVVAPSLIWPDAYSRTFRHPAIWKFRRINTSVKRVC